MKRGLLATFTACATALALVACGGDDSSDTTTAPATTAAATTAPAATTAAPTTTTEASTTAAPTTTTEAPTTTTEPEQPTLRVVLSNDDSYAAEGIDTVARAMLDMGLDVTIVAPATQQSGQGGNVTGGPLNASDVTTISGLPAKAVEGTPTDSIIWALDQGGIDFVPDLVVSGTNEGQNLGPVVDFSGTVGAARAAANRNIPAIAISSGFGDPIDYAGTAEALVAYLNAHLDEIAAHEPGTPVETVVSINVPTCIAGTTNRGPIDVPLGSSLYDFDYTAPVDCGSTVENPVDDVQAFFNGFIAISPTPLKPAATS